MRYKINFLNSETGECGFDFIFYEAVVLELKNNNPSCQIYSVTQQFWDDEVGAFVESENLLDFFKNLLTNQ